jgi:hypothetical protein
MTQPARKISGPILIRRDTPVSPAPSRLGRFLEHYERRSIVGKAILWGALVILVGLLLDYFVGLLGLPRLEERIVENTIEGVLFIALVYSVLHERDRRLRRRFKEVGYLNHHIRNSLTVIEMAEGYVGEADQRLEMVKQASKRIRSCIEKISREEDCEISKQTPHEP